MILLAFTVLWTGEVLAGLLFFEMFLVLARAFVEIFYGRHSPVSFALRAMTEPVLGPLRRFTAPLRLPFDPAPWLAALLLYAGQIAVIAASRGLFLRLMPWPVAKDPFLDLVATVLRYPLWIYMLIVLLRVALQWFGSPSYHPFVRIVVRLVDPVLGQIRRLFRPRYGSVDLAPMLLVAGLWFVDRVILEVLPRGL